MAETLIEEAAIRDEIAARPALVEVGLTTIEKNYYLPNSEGTRGFIDVLARDRHGLFVVIEVKRLDSTAREAIHEVLKYCELLRAERGLRSDQVRAIIASSTWRELMVPFSQMSRVSDYPIDGVELSVDEGFPSSLRGDRITPLAVPPEPDLSALALRIELDAPGEAERQWPEIVSRLAEVGIDDALGIVIGNESRTILHVALGTVVEGDPRIPTSRPEDDDEDRGEHLNEEHHHEDDEDGDDDFNEAPEGQEREYAAALHLLKQLPGAELVSPERLYRIMDSNRLNSLKVFRSGRFESQADLLNDDEAVRLAEGTSGWNQVTVDVTGKPSHALAWRRLRSQLGHALFGNPRWTRLLGLWLDEIERSHPTSDVVLHVYNPCDLMAALVHSGLGGDLQRLLPQIEGALDLPGEDGRVLEGALVWDGTPVTTAAAAIQTVYERPGDWGIARALGGVWAEDLRLLDALGLRYDLFEIGPGDPGFVCRLDEGDGVLTRQFASDPMEWPDCRPFPEWLRTVELGDLMEQYRSIMVPVNGGDQWLVMDGLRSQPEG